MGLFSMILLVIWNLAIIWASRCQRPRTSHFPTLRRLLRECYVERRVVVASAPEISASLCLILCAKLQIFV